MDSKSEEKEKYDWDAERESIHVPPSEIDPILFELFGCKEKERKRITNGICNVIFEITTTNDQQFILKISHPHWNGTGKLWNEVKCLKFAKANTTIPVPTVFYYKHIPRDEEVVKDESVTFKRYLKEKREGRREHEWALMEKMPGVALSDFWDQLSWEERKPYIDQLVGYISQLKKWRYPLIGSFIDEQCTEIGSDLDFGGGPYSSYAESKIPLIDKFLSLDLSSYCGGKFKQCEEQVRRVRKYLENYDIEVPITFNHCDLAPKNTLVDKDTSRITAILDWEWSGPGPIDIDIAETDYGDEESFSDSPDVSLEEQQEYIYKQFENHGVPLPEGYHERDTVLGKICGACSDATKVQPDEDGEEDLANLLEALSNFEEE